MFFTADPATTSSTVTTDTIACMAKMEMIISLVPTEMTSCLEEMAMTYLEVGLAKTS